MNTYTVTLEHNKQVKTVEARGGIECLKALIAQDRSAYEGDTTYFLLRRVGAGITVRYAVRCEKGQPPRVEIIGLAAT